MNPMKPALNGFCMPINFSPARVELWAIAFAQDNYLWALREVGGALPKAWLIDPGSAEVAAQWLEQSQSVLQGILITHRHVDHIGGLPSLIQHYPQTQVIGPASIGLVTQPISEGQSVVLFDQMKFVAIATPGHTEEHLVYLHPELLFCGDLIFSYGCGRVFEGSVETLFASLCKVMTLCRQNGFDPWVCSAHEYTIRNLEFCLTILPHEQQWQKKLAEARETRRKHLPTLPFRWSAELIANPFLALTDEVDGQYWRNRLHDVFRSSLQARAMKQHERVFAELRHRRNQY